jgi:hypothetical protein
MSVLVLLAATAALSASAFAQTDDSSQGIETATEIGYRFDAASTILRLIPVFIVGAGIAGFIIWKQRNRASHK